MLRNNNLKFKLILVSLAFCLVLILSVFLGSSVTGADQPANAAAGSADDPIVTLSYINKVFKPQIEQLISDKLKDFKPAASTSTSASTPAPATTEPTIQNTYIMSDAASSSYIVLELTKGQKLRVKSGSLEIILRPGGVATVISDYKSQGIADLTTGDELLNGKSLPINHALLIPRADGRGISITSVIAYIMVRGDYEIFE
ncbi:MAG: hypothetical protein FWF92_06435 [Oscillospiraceae bacterium]|nr:hypothetical protein [Oscillospiraceae bacterium]